MEKESDVIYKRIYFMISCTLKILYFYGILLENHYGGESNDN